MATVAMAHSMAPAHADDPSSDPANQVAGLFVQSCVQFAGHKDDLRAWARQIGLKALPVSAQELFLNGLPGVVFDASNRVGKFVVVSEDRGSCSVVAEKADGPAVIADLEQDMNDAKISLKLTDERLDAEEKALNHREYLASQGNRAWLLLISTVRNAAGGQAMLTATRN